MVLYYSGHCRRLVKGFAVASISRRLIDVLARCGLLLALAFVAQCRAQTAPSGMQVFNFLDYGAKNDASALATGAFGCAIQAAKAAGGGTVYVPPGKYTSGPIELFSNMTLDVDSGATIDFPVAAIPFEKTRYLGKGQQPGKFVERSNPLAVETRLLSGEPSSTFRPRDRHGAVSSIHRNPRRGRPAFPATSIRTNSAAVRRMRRLAHAAKRVQLR